MFCFVNKTAIKLEKKAPFLGVGPEARKMRARPEPEPLGPTQPEPEGPKPDPTRARKKEACIQPYFLVVYRV